MEGTGAIDMLSEENNTLSAMDTEQLADMPAIVPDESTNLESSEAAVAEPASSLEDSAVPSLGDLPLPDFGSSPPKAGEALLISLDFMEHSDMQQDGAEFGGEPTAETHADATSGILDPSAADAMQVSQGEGFSTEGPPVDESMAAEPEQAEQSAEKIVPEKEYIHVEVVSQRQSKMITVDLDYDIFQLRSMVQAKFQVDLVEQVCLIKDQRMLNDGERVRDLGLSEGSQLFLAIRYFPADSQPSVNGMPSQPFFWPSQYSRLGLPNFDLSELQEEMQKQFNENPDLVREALANPMVQDLMSNPAMVKDLMLGCPGGQELLEKRPDIIEALNQPKFLEESITIARDPALLEETLSKIDVAANASHATSASGSAPQAIPTTETMMKMTAQDPRILQHMFQSPYYKSMIEGMVANPAWTEKMLINNPIFATNSQMKQQIKSYLPQFLNQLQSPDYVAVMSNPKALQAMLKIQQGITNLQHEAPNLTASMGFPSYATPGTFNIQVEGDNEPGGVIRPNKGEIDPMSIMMGQVIHQTGDGTIGLPLEQRYTKDLDLMERMGFNDRQTNLALLMATFGDVNAAVSQLLLQQQE